MESFHSPSHLKMGGSPCCMQTWEGLGLDGEASMKAEGQKERQGKKRRERRVEVRIDEGILIG